jgi:glycosyltransferase involved in cell wall biosynthesis
VTGPSVRYSFVVPLYNEEETVPELRARLTAVMDSLDGESEAILVDDGSRDRTLQLLIDAHGEDVRFKVVSLSRNFGHQVAVTAGLDFARGDAVILMDGDLQDPPELASELIARWRDGAEIVYAVREDRTVEPFFRRHAISFFYRLLRRFAHVDIPVDAGDFRLIDRRAVDALRRMPESNRYVRGLVAWVGFRQVGVPYRRDARHAGRTKYPLRKLVTLALDGVVGFSTAPLKLSLVVGFLVSAAAFVFAIVIAVLRLAGVAVVGRVPGWTSIVFVVSILGGLQLVVLGMIGIYLGRLYEEAKRRPLYLVAQLRGLDENDARRTE